MTPIPLNCATVTTPNQYTSDTLYFVLLDIHLCIQANLVFSFGCSRLGFLFLVKVFLGSFNTFSASADDGSRDLQKPENTSIILHPREFQKCQGSSGSFRFIKNYQKRSIILHSRESQNYYNGGKDYLLI